MKHFLRSFVLGVSLCVLGHHAWATEAVTRLACVGDSITVGAGVSDRETRSYPALLKSWLGPEWEVANFGASGSTLLRKGNLPYFERPQFKKALAFAPDVAVITFGANDSKHGDANNAKIADNWQYKAEFVADYRTLLSELRAVNPKVKIYLGLPVAAFKNRYGIDGAVIENEIVPLVRQVAAQENAQTIDLHSAVNTPELFKDGVHPNDAGTRAMATTIYRALTGKDAPADAAALTALAPINAAPKLVAVADIAPAADAPDAATSSEVALPSKENFHLYLLMGQSNMAGRAAIDATQTGNARVLALNSEGKWVVARDPLHAQVGRTIPGAGPGLPFALNMLPADSKVTIGLIPTAVGGSPMVRWSKGKRGDLYDNAIKQAKSAMPVGTLKGVLWHQGESDSDREPYADAYQGRLTQMIADLRADLDAPNLPVVVGQIGEFLTPEKQPFADTVRAAIKNVGTTVPNVGYADSAGLGDKGDKLHFDAAAQKEMGARFAAAMKKLQTP